MKWRLPAFGPFAVVILCLFAIPIQAQTTEANPKLTPRPQYDVAKEVTLRGTVSSVVKTPTRQMKMLVGSHLVVETNSGQIDASLGRFALRGNDALSVTPGQQVQMTGVMKTIGGQLVFVTRLLQVNGRLYTIRNEHGFALSQSSRKGGSHSEAKGGRL